MSRSGVGLRSADERVSPEPRSRRSEGTVTAFDRCAASGFIREHEGDREFYFRHTGVRGTILGLLTEGDRVEFDQADSVHGPQGRDVVRLDP